MTEHTVASLAALVAGRLIGDGARRIAGVCDLRHGQADRIGFVRDAKYRDAAKDSAAGALITPVELDTPVPQIVVQDVGLAYARVAATLHPPPRAEVHRVDPAAVVDPAAELAAPVQIGPRAVVGRAHLGAGTVVMPGAVIGDDVRLGRDCVIYPNVTIYSGVSLGDRVIVHSGTVIGSDGFGYAKDGAAWLKVPQLGSVVVEDDVEIGANCTIDRGAMGDTRIGTRSKIDNLCHIAHNVRLGQDCALAAASLVAGSTTVGDRVILGGHVSIAGHLRIANDVRIGGGSILFHGVHKSGDVMGYPTVEKKLWLRYLRDQKKAMLRGAGGAGASTDAPGAGPDAE